MDALLKGKVALVTGAGRGIGAAIAGAMAAAGARVIVADRDAQAAMDCAATLRGKALQAEAENLDVTDLVAVQALADAVQVRHGGLDVLVNNAGIAMRSGLEDADARAVWQRVLAVNLQAAFDVTQAFVPALKRRRDCIINLSSVVAFRAGVSSPAYVTSKGAVRSLTQALARDLAVHGIRVNALAPGLIHTDMTAPQRESPGGTDWYLSQVPQRRLGEPEEVAAPAVFLASSWASYINGAVLPVDGGYLAV